MANETNNKSSPIPEDQDTYLFMGPVTDESCKDLIGYILLANINNPRAKYLKLIINSVGGDLNSAFAVVDILVRCA